MKIQRGNPIKLTAGKQAEISHQFRNKTENENIGKILKEKSFEDILYFFLSRVTEMSSKKSLKRIAIETGIVVLLGFATGWTIVKTILDTTNPDDLNNNLHSAVIGIGSGTTLGVATSGYTIKWIQTK